MKEFLDKIELLENKIEDYINIANLIIENSKEILHNFYNVHYVSTGLTGIIILI
jgi:hypothetical protein